MNHNETINVEQFPPLQEFILNHLESFAIFSEHINKQKKVFFEGEGKIFFHTTINQVSFQDTFYLFGLNGCLYASAVKENRKNRVKYFDGIYELDLSLFNSSLFKDIQLINHNSRYKNFGAKIEIDFKFYNYSDEEKLLFSNKGKVDLLYSQQLILQDNTSTLKVQVYPSLKQVVQWTKMVEQVNERTKQFIAARDKS